MTAARELEHDPAERGFRILAEMLEEGAAVQARARPTLRVMAVDVIRARRGELAHGVLSCPRCGLHVDQRDVVRRIWDEPPGSTPRAAEMCHKRCGHYFTVQFTD